MKNMQNKDFKVDFIGIGTSRSASTWIYECLREHPQICMSQPKETRFFAELNYDCGLNYYKKCFSHCKDKNIKGEYTPAYLTDERSPFLIKEHFPDIKLIVCLRNPIEKVFSSFVYAQKGGKTPSTKSFETHLKESNLIKTGEYYPYLKRYFNLFPKENILILIYEDIAKDSTKFIQRIYKFLNVNRDFIPENITKKMNSGDGKQSKFLFIPRTYFSLRKSLRKSKLGKKIRIILKLLKLNQLATAILKANRKYNRTFQKPLMNSQTRKFLQKHYDQDIKNLEKLINRDLSFWK